MPNFPTEDDDVITGTTGDETISALGGNDIVYGLAGSDVLNGDAGDDALHETGTGSNTVNGGTGTDTLVLDYSASPTQVTTSIPLSANVSLGGFNGRYSDISGRSTSFTSIERFVITTGNSGFDQIVTGSGDDVVTLNDGNDTADVGGGINTADGGAGQDGLSANFSALGSGVAINLQEATSSGEFGTYSNFEYFFALVGSGFDDNFVTTTAAIGETISLGAGDDSATVLRGSDSVNGGTGTDTLVIDYSALSSAFQTANTLVANGTDGGFNGSYTSYASGTTVQFTSIDRFIITTGAGADGITTASGDDIILSGAGNDVINAGAGDDDIDGQSGNDTINGEAGNDTLRISGTPLDLGLEAANGGADFDTLILDYSTMTTMVGLYVSSDGGVAGGGASGFIDIPNGSRVANFTGLEQLVATTGSGNDTINGFSGGNQIYSGAGSDLLIGGAGNDYLDGGSDADEMRGGAGVDIYIVDNAGDVIIENPNEGEDEVRVGASSYTLPENVEVLVAANGDAHSFFGNAQSNVIIGGEGVDQILVHQGGNDAIDAAGGNDFIYLGATLTSADYVYGGAGTDTLGLLGDYSSGLTLDTAQLNGVERLVVYSGTQGGGVSNFNYALTTTDAAVAAGTQLVVRGVALTSSEGLFFDGSLETDGTFYMLGGAGADVFIGGALGDNISGNAGNDGLYGNGGNDILFGGLGADQLAGGLGNDRFRYDNVAQSTATSTDTITDFEQGLDKIDLSLIDADGGAGTGNTFAFIGSGAFSNTAGELRATNVGDIWTVEGDVDGDGAADFVLTVHMTTADPLQATDFFL